MERPFCTYKLMSYEPNSYFIGANSERGFILAQNEKLSEENFDRVFILKGGPGTGKSTFMKKASNEAKKKNYNVEYYYCSSDPDSLDAVIIENADRRFMIIDGTNPHITEMCYPGAVSEIINLSIMWDNALLGEYKEKIFELTKKKGSCFDDAYKYLSAASQLHHSQQKISYRVCDIDKLNEAVYRFCLPFRKMHGIIERVYTDAFSMKGAIAANSYFSIADKIFYLSDHFGIFEIYLERISSVLDKNNVGYVKIISPVNSEVINGIYITNGKILIVSSKYSGELPAGKTVNMKRFLNENANAYKGRYRFGIKCENALYEGAFECLSEAKKYHFELESIYSSSMNFKKANRIYSDKISAIL